LGLVILEVGVAINGNITKQLVNNKILSQNRGSRLLIRQTAGIQVNVECSPAGISLHNINKQHVNKEWAIKSTAVDHLKSSTS